MLSVLSAVRDGADKPTRIMYASNQSWKPSQRMLSYMVEQGLVEMTMIPTAGKPRKRYIVTEKGVNVLNYFEKANEVLPQEEYAGLYSKVPG